MASIVSVTALAALPGVEYFWIMRAHQSVPLMVPGSASIGCMLLFRIPPPKPMATDVQRPTFWPCPA